MAIPGSSDGQEVLRRGGITGQSNDPTSFDFTGGLPTVGDETDTVAANHIITVLNIIFCETSGGEEQILMYQNTTQTIYLMYNQVIGGYKTFIWNDKFVLTGGQSLVVNMASSTTVDIWYSYLDQDWS